MMIHITRIPLKKGEILILKPRMAKLFFVALFTIILLIISLMIIYLVTNLGGPGFGH